jgi:hypothetical protein
VKCRNCDREIRPVADGDGIDPADWNLYPWVDGEGDPICGYDEEEQVDLLHEPDDHRA